MQSRHWLPGYSALERGQWAEYFGKLPHVIRRPGRNALLDFAQGSNPRFIQAFMKSIGDRQPYPEILILPAVDSRRAK